LFNTHCSTKEQAACGYPKQDQLAEIEHLPKLAVRGTPVPVPSPWSRPHVGTPPPPLHAFMPSSRASNQAVGWMGVGLARHGRMGWCCASLAPLLLFGDTVLFFVIRGAYPFLFVRDAYLSDSLNCNSLKCIYLQLAWCDPTSTKAPSSVHTSGFVHTADKTQKSAKAPITRTTWSANIYIYCRANHTAEMAIGSIQILRSTKRAYFLSSL
jgi:hypothetical protein